jgi:hypothetical protein
MATGICLYFVDPALTTAGAAIRQLKRRNGSRLRPVEAPKGKSSFSFPRCLCTVLMIATNETVAEEVISLLRTQFRSCVPPASCISRCLAPLPGVRLARTAISIWRSSSIGTPGWTFLRSRVWNVVSPKFSAAKST